MKSRVSTVFCTLALILALVAGASGQTALTSTTFSSAVTATATEVYLASVTGVAAASGGASIGSILVSGPEAMKVLAVDSTNKRVSVQRGYAGTVTAHASGAVVYEGGPSEFANREPYGPCTAGTDWAYTPLITLGTGRLWNCVGGTWAQVSQQTPTSSTLIQAGTPATSVTAEEHVSGLDHVTKLTFSAKTVGAVAAGASEGIGVLVYTFPAGGLLVKSAYMSIALSDTADLIDADTPDGGLGTTVASGAVAVLSGTAAFENILTGQTFNDVNGTAETKTVSDQPLSIASGGNHTVYFNLADGWAGADAGVKITGTIVLEWRQGTAAEVTLSTNIATELNTAEASLVAAEADIDDLEAGTAVSNLGAAATGVTATEYGDGINHVTKLTFSAKAVAAVAGAADEGIGVLMYTFPAGNILVRAAYMSIALGDTADLIDADTPDGGLGTTVASGAVALLSGTAAFENILTGQTFNDVNGTAEVKTVSDQPLTIAAGGNHTVYLNLADGWAGADAGVTATGTIVLEWTFGTAAEHTLSSQIATDLNTAETNITNIENGVTAVNLGTANTGVTATEKGGAYHHVTSLAFTDLAIDTTVAAANEAYGKLLYTFPAGTILIHGAGYSVALTGSGTDCDADTPDAGLGTTIASGAQATLDQVAATAEDILTGQTVNDLAATVEIKTLNSTVAIEAASSDRKVHLNIADSWTAGGCAVTATGTVLVEWSKLN